MRCLTLADELRSHGAECHFLTRHHPGSLVSHIQSRGYSTHVLPLMATDTSPADNTQVTHAEWLGATQHQDAESSLRVLKNLHPECIVVDHYAIDAHWEHAMRPHCKTLMVIDDLADRSHDCDVLLDQTLGRNPLDYKPWVPDSCVVLCGTEYALLRPEFIALRPYSLQRRKRIHSAQNLLITMGGMDPGNATERVLDALFHCNFPSESQITVVMGSFAPWLAAVKDKAAQMPLRTRVLVSVNNMAELMAESDLAIGAAGSTSWERCCLGLPTLQVVLANNQRSIASALQQAGAAKCTELHTMNHGGFKSEVQHPGFQ